MSFEYQLVDPDFYLPPECSINRKGEREFTPQRPPSGWVRELSGVWVGWRPPGVSHLPDQGWKVHVSTRLARADYTLEVVARICGNHDVTYKHIATRRLFLYLHHKHGPRVQSGKFATLYPRDTDTARAVMDELADALHDEEGPYVLTDRRYRDSRVVSYRYGAFRSRTRLTAAGLRTPTMLDADGTEVSDERRPEFVLPEGMIDPFAVPPPAADDGPIAFDGYRFTGVLRHSNGGGAYTATDATDRTVFIKEARAYTGYQWDHTTAADRLHNEYRMLCLLHASRPGLCPEPLRQFRHWEHEFLVTEFVPGVPLSTWTSRNTPMFTANPTAATVAAYFLRCQAVLARLTEQVEALHELGYAFVDLNPFNVLVDENDHPRLIDFETACPVGSPGTLTGAHGFVPPEATRSTAARAPLHFDEYGLAALAQAMLLPLNGELERNPDTGPHLRAALEKYAPVPDPLWNAATRFRPARATSPLPGPDEVAAAPLVHLAALRAATVEGILAMTNLDDTGPVFPLTPQGYRTNPHNLAHGTAGVLYALHRSGIEPDRALVSRFRADVRAAADDLPPGLFTGLAGIAWVLAELGFAEQSAELLEAARRHPLTASHATLGEGAAGVAMALLAQHRRTGEERDLRHAHQLLSAVPDGPQLVAAMGGADTSGWRGGRAGIAHACHHAALLCAAPELLERGRMLLHDDLAHGHPIDGGGLNFTVSTTDRRSMPYLAFGSAGFAMVAGLYLPTSTDGVLADAYERAVASTRVGFTVATGLFEGVAGLGLGLAEHAEASGDPGAAAAAVQISTGLFRHAIPRGLGVGFLPDWDGRFAPELARGSAGVLVLLARLLDGTADPLFSASGLLTITPDARALTPAA